MVFPADSLMNLVKALASLEELAVDPCDIRFASCPHCCSEVFATAALPLQLFHGCLEVLRHVWDRCDAMRYGKHCDLNRSDAN